MSDKLLLAYCTTVSLAALTGGVRYACLSAPLRVVVWLLLLTAICEWVAYFAYSNKMYVAKGAIYHFFNMVQATLLSAYFILLSDVQRKRILIVASAIIWTLTGTLNMLLLQPMEGLNSNMLMVESFAFITLSLNDIYQQLRAHTDVSTFTTARFAFAMICLIMWSSTLFFWATVKILHTNHWKHIDTLINANIVNEIVMYLAITTILLSRPKHTNVENI